MVFESILSNVLAQTYTRIFVKKTTLPLLEELNKRIKSLLILFLIPETFIPCRCYPAASRKSGGEKALSTKATSVQQRQRIKLCIALLSKMASGSELPEYSSPAKRRKVDGNDYAGTSTVKPDFQHCETSHDTPNEDLEGILRKICLIQ